MLGIVVFCAGLAVAVLFLWRPDIPFAKLEAKYANAQSRFMDLPGGLRIHYRDQGARDGPPIVMIHGYSASLHAWEPWIARLGDRYRIVTLDLPGHGLTRAPSTYVASLDRYAEVVDTVAERLKLGPYVAVGNSMGGGVAWTLALHHPDHLRGLVLVDSVGWPAPKGEDGSSSLVYKVLSSPIGLWALKNLDTRWYAAGGLRSAYVDPALATPALIDRYIDLSRAPGHRAILLNVGASPGAPVTAETLKQIRTPTLVMHGEADAIIPLAIGQALAAAIPGARLVTYPGVGHVPMEQSPDLTAHDLRAFLESLPPTS
jgi:pimeloyl-ACP methyl ester carboxylesterase